MSQFSDFLRRHALIAGIVLMFLFTWPIDLAHSGVLPFQVPFAVYILLGWGFILAAVIMTGLTLGRGAVIALLKRYLLWRVSWKWYLVALLLFPVTIFFAVFLNAVLTRTTLDFSQVFAYQIFGPSANLPLLFIPFLLFDAVANGEEIGWRGYVLPRLQVKNSALLSSLIVGVVWGFWHLPKFLAPGNTSSFALFMVKCIPDAIIYTWLYNNTRGSLLLVTLLHAAGNAAGVFLPVANTVSGGNQTALIIQIALEILIAVVVVVQAGAEQLSRTEEKQILT